MVYYALPVAVGEWPRVWIGKYSVMEFQYTGRRPQDGRAAALCGKNDSDRYGRSLVNGAGMGKLGIKEQT